ncbi:MAG: diguanylate cyclase [Campylobacterales bacterium]|nr:diguanylate cyclase [Campylobacterales bacterium]
MKFPTIRDIATKDVVTVNMTDTISVAVESIFESQHRTALVPHEGEYFVFGAADLLKMSASGLDVQKPLNTLTLRKVPSIHRNKNVLDVLDIVDRPTECEQMAVVDEDEQLCGIVTHTDITNNIDPETLMENYKLQDFLKLGKRMKWISKDISTAELFQDIAMQSFDNAIVVEDAKPIGIITTKDVMRLVKEKLDLSRSIEHYMSTPVETISKSASIKEALDFMRINKFKRAVVVDAKGRLEGVITQKELISLTYSRWARLIKEYHEELNSINSTLEDKANEYEKKASVDTLTGLYNRSKFGELFNLAYKNMLSRESPLSLLLIDIDHFKVINDSYGHNRGDDVLVAVAHTLSMTLRNIDIVCRWGGEEFVALLPTADLKQALLIAEKIRKNIKELEFTFVKDVTASFGVSEVRRKEGMLEAIERADKALYMAKNSGRNRVVSETDI